MFPCEVIGKISLDAGMVCQDQKCYGASGTLQERKQIYYSATAFVVAIITVIAEHVPIITLYECHLISDKQVMRPSYEHTSV